MLGGSALAECWRRLPLVGLERIGTGPFVVLAPHPDDETLGCGGLIAEACSAGRDVWVAILTDGSGSHRSALFPPMRLAALRRTEAWAAAAALGLPQERLIFMGFRDGAAPHTGAEFEAAAARLAALLASPNGTVLATWRHDPHPDHLAAHLIAAEAARRAGGRHLAYPIWGWALASDAGLPESATAGVRLDISPRLAAKRRAIAAHATQFGGAVTDDPASRLAPEMLANFLQPFEVLLECASIDR